MIERGTGLLLFVFYILFLVSQQLSARGFWPVVMFYLGSQQFSEGAGILFVYFI